MKLRCLSVVASNLRRCYNWFDGFMKIREVVWVSYPTACGINFLAGIYLLKVNNRNIRTRCEIYFTPCSSVSIVNFEHVIANMGLRLTVSFRFFHFKVHIWLLRHKWEYREAYSEPWQTSKMKHFAKKFDSL